MIISRMTQQLWRSHADFYGGTSMLVTGLWVTVQSFQYEVGSLSAMGPGFFPAVLGITLSLLGIGIVVTAGKAEVMDDSGEVGAQKPEWRAWFLIVLGIVAFVVLGRWGGLIPASFAVVFISALGDRKNTLVSASILALAICVVAAVVFRWALQLQLPLFSWGG